MNKSLNFKNKDLFIFKALYKNKYVGYYNVPNRTLLLRSIKVYNTQNENDEKKIPINKCKIYLWTKEMDLNGIPIFENDVVLTPDKTQLGVVIYDNCKFYIQYNTNTVKQINRKFLNKCEFFCDAIVDRNLLSAAISFTDSEDIPQREGKPTYFNNFKKGEYDENNY